jgi:glycosyltransferase involved in cell wall biosynthesis
VLIGYDATLLRSQPAGVEKTISALLRSLLELGSGHKFKVYCGSGMVLPDWLMADNVSIHRMIFPSQWRSARVLWQQLRLPRLARAHKLDIFLGPAYVLPRKMPVPCVLLIADLIAITHPELCRKSSVAHLKRVLPGSCSLAERIITPSAASARVISSKLNQSPKKIDVVPHGIESRFFQEIPNNELAVIRARNDFPAKFALFVGQIEPKKNLVALVRAFYSAVENKQLPHKLLICGKLGWRWKTLVRTIRGLGLRQKVLFTGYLPDAVMPALYSMADALLMPSITEGFGLPALEAAACGTAVLTSEDPALCEISAGAALHVDAQDSGCLRHGIERILTDQQLRQQLTSKGPQRAKEFTWQKTAQQVMSILEKVNDQNIQIRQ